MYIFIWDKKIVTVLSQNKKEFKKGYLSLI